MCRKRLDLDVAGDVAHHVGAEAVGAHEGVGVDDRAVDVALGGEVHHRVVARHGRGHGLAVADVALHERVAGVVGDVGEAREVAGVGEGVVDGDLVVGGGEHVADVVGSDEPGRAGDEELHGSRTSRRGRGHGRRPMWGCHCGSISARRGLAWSRADRIGSATPQSAPIAGSSQATPSSSVGL